MTQLRRCFALLFAVMIFSAGLSAAGLSFAEDWPQWQGPQRNAVSPETGLLQQWPDDGPALAWRVEGLGGGDSAPSIAGGRIYGMSNRGNDEIVWAISEDDGSEIWVSRLGPAYEQERSQSQEGPGCTPTVDGERLYVIGLGGTVSCLSLSDGEIIWQRSMTEDFGGIVPTWSYRESPLVDGDQVICTPGGPNAVMVALDKMTGETVWECEPPQANQQADANQNSGRNQGRNQGRRGRGGRGRGFQRGPRAGAAYCSAIAVEIEGVRQYVQLTATAVIGVAAADGEFLWQYAHPANSNGINCSTPLYQDGLIFAASAYGNGGGAAKVTQGSDGTWNAEEVYFSTSMQNHHGGMIVVDGALFGANGGNGGGFMACLDFQTGEILWRDRAGPKGSLAMADGRLYLRSEEDEILLLEPNREELVVRGRFEQPDRTNLPAWAHPVIANGKLYIRDQGLLLCYDVSAAAE